MSASTRTSEATIEDLLELRAHETGAETSVVCGDAAPALVGVDGLAGVLRG